MSCKIMFTICAIVLSDDCDMLCHLNRAIRSVADHEMQFNQHLILLS